MSRVSHENDSRSDSTDAMRFGYVAPGNGVCRLLILPYPSPTMLSFTGLSVVTLALLGASVTASPTTPRREESLTARAGPSGYVIYPPGGTNFDIIGGELPTGGITYINIQYQGVSTTVGDQGYTTVGVDIYLQDPNGVQADLPLASNFGNPDGGVIEGNFVPPGETCGTYNLVFIEHQNLGINGQTIDFQSAAPSINIYCSPIQK